MANPLAGNPLCSRADLQKAVHDLWQPLKPYFSPGQARVTLGVTGTNYATKGAELEGFSRPLWGLVPLAAGNGNFEEWERFRQGVTNGTNPDHPEFWGNPVAYDQRMVEMAVIGLALALTPEIIWQPLTLEAKASLANWLVQINNCQMPDNNWLFFRVLVNLGLSKVGVATDKAVLNASLDRLEEFYLGDGWYSDGFTRQRDYYIPTAFHFYSLIYASLNGETDPLRAERFKARAKLFAEEFIHWFAADGAAIPFGRSLTYRFAAGSFWGALAFAEVEAMPWGIIKGLWLRHLRWWAAQPIFNSDGTLSIGYAYPNLNMAEVYNSPGSPYWAFKFFLPLALPQTHPFWQAEEMPLPDLPPVKVQKQPGMIVCANPDRSHVFALSSGQEAMQPWLRHGEAKYAKFAYSTAFGFSVPGWQYGWRGGAYDSMLAISDDNHHFRVREKLLEAGMRGEWLYSRWQAYNSIEVETWLLPCLPWHIRVHHICANAPFYTMEAGFAVDCTNEDFGHDDQLYQRFESNDAALAAYPSGWSGIKDLPLAEVARAGRVELPDSNTNLLYPRTALPALFGEYTVGEHWLACAVLSVPVQANNNNQSEKNLWQIWQNPPVLARTENSFTVSYANSNLTLTYLYP